MNNLFYLKYNHYYSHANNFVSVADFKYIMLPDIT